ncbi:MAG TPA: OmpA family protein [Thermoanaerobaculia bacterium]|nr:OmpA family protein [Thermoanaerobaculia bacterium]
MKKSMLLLALAAGLLATGCASKKYVAGEVATVNQRVDDVETKVEETQSGLRRHDEAIAKQGETINQQGQQIQSTSKTAQEALRRAEEAGKLAQGKLLYEAVFSDDKVRFALDKADLGEEAGAALKQFADQLKAENANVYIEIQGHTDSVGSDDYNYKLGESRAEAVRRFLNKEGGIPLHKMSVISYGESEPVADNKTREGRAQNRRVVLVVLQ